MSLVLDIKQFVSQSTTSAQGITVIGYPPQGLYIQYCYQMVSERELLKMRVGGSNLLSVNASGTPTMLGIIQRSRHQLTVPDFSGNKSLLKAYLALILS